MDITIGQIETEDDFEAVRGLVREFFGFAQSVDPHAHEASGFAGLEAELASLPGICRPPSGAFLLARVDGAPMGCGASFDHGGGKVEVKRMYVRPEARGLSLGRGIVEGLLNRARALGNDRIVLSTYYKLEAAQALYARMGFSRCAPT
ncbi:GNAT family N-acetyltransferase [Alphaproteobacteria bacterium GH1-50]|uniref:GNAT family N-acetyltransferase n=1 Tax=Kangsaoukella pontilimi TaxID=2691042 RepID=A0A7C9N1F3_9RHOB|nr:GNAT family N-acetyltransferase [Kangsaoukella pontilimi]MXQ08698.1 GNAT family N-acetyltransferase [Kangsaoukella pontilimi]